MTDRSRADGTPAIPGAAACRRRDVDTGGVWQVFRLRHHPLSWPFPPDFSALPLPAPTGGRVVYIDLRSPQQRGRKVTHTHQPTARVGEDPRWNSPPRMT